MIKFQRLGSVLLLAGFFMSTANLQAVQPDTTNYAYPVTDAYTATIIGTPTDYRAELPEYNDIPAKDYTLEQSAKSKPVPEVFWYESRGFRYTLSAQEHEAPLVFAIAGTGAGTKSEKMRLFQRAYYKAGFHVVSISSPTFSNFMLNASEHAIPGNFDYDAADIYGVMQAIRAQHPELSVSHYYLTGYSLGAAQAAFVSYLDETEKQFNFKKVLLINPPLSLYNSVGVLDKMLEDHIPGGLNNFNEFFQQLIAEVSRHHKDNPNVNIFSSDFLFKAYKNKDLSEDMMQAIIGISFRFSSANIMFISDVRNELGYIVPKGTKLTSTTSLTNYSKVARRLKFSDYVNEIYIPYFQKLTNAGREDLIQQTSLLNISDYLKTNSKLGLMHNENDPILKSGEIAIFKDLFPGRAVIYPYGGHCGNMAYKDNVNYMVNFFKDGNNNDIAAINGGSMK